MKQVQMWMKGVCSILGNWQNDTNRQTGKVGKRKKDYIT
jgi:hypothetical protein